MQVLTDRELLELAAKAAGYATSHRWNAERLTLCPPVADLCINGVSTAWNPLESDAERYRCAKVCMSLCRVIEEPHEFERCAEAIRAME